MSGAVDQGMCLGKIAGRYSYRAKLTALARAFTAVVVITIWFGFTRCVTAQEASPEAGPAKRSGTVASITTSREEIDIDVDGPPRKHFRYCWGSFIAVEDAQGNVLPHYIYGVGAKGKRVSFTAVPTNGQSKECQSPMEIMSIRLLDQPATEGSLPPKRTSATPVPPASGSGRVIEAGQERVTISVDGSLHCKYNYDRKSVVAVDSTGKPVNIAEMIGSFVNFTAVPNPRHRWVSHLSPMLITKIAVAPPKSGSSTAEQPSPSPL